jgi:putative membrane protein
MKSNLLKTVGTAALLFSLTVWAQQDPADPHHGETKQPAKGEATAKLTPADKDFILGAAIGGLAEVAMGQLAVQNGASKQVKDFGERLMADHGRVNRELEQVVAPYKVALPTRMDEEHQRHYDMLKAKKGADFDSAFATHMVEGHEKMITLFKKQASAGGAVPLKEFAVRTLPLLEQHLKIAKDLVKTRTSSR